MNELAMIESALLVIGFVLGLAAGYGLRECPREHPYGCPYRRLPKK